MLVLTRKVGEQINIGDDIVVSVVEIDSGKVRIGIEAPGNVMILRQEVYERIRQENLKSSQESLTDLAGVARLWREKNAKA